MATLLDLPDLEVPDLQKVVTEFRSEGWKQANGTLTRVETKLEVPRTSMKIGDFLGDRNPSADSLREVFEMFTPKETVKRTYCAMGVIGKVLLNLEDEILKGGSLLPWGIDGPYCAKVIGLNDRDVTLYNIGNAIEWALLSGLHQSPGMMHNFAQHLQRGGRVKEFTG